MQSEPIFILNTKVYALEEDKGYFTVSVPEGRRVVRNIENIGSPFSIITKKKIDKINLLEYSPEFKELANPIPQTGTLGEYLRNANIETTLCKRENNTPKYLGVTYGKTTTIEVIADITNSKSKTIKYVVPCHFYLIHDNLENIVL